MTKSEPSTASVSAAACRERRPARRSAAAGAADYRAAVRSNCEVSGAKVKAYEGHTGRNPRTGEAIDVAPKVLPLFKRAGCCSLG